MNEKKAKVTDNSKCIECGACMKNRAFGAIKAEAGPGCAAAVLISQFSGKKNVCC